jgi:hypothetical protein
MYRVRCPIMQSWCTATPSHVSYSTRSALRPVLCCTTQHRRQHNTILPSAVHTMHDTAQQGAYTLLHAASPGRGGCCCRLQQCVMLVDAQQRCRHTLNLDNRWGQGCKNAPQVSRVCDGLAECRNCSPCINAEWNYD